MYRPILEGLQILGYMTNFGGKSPQQRIMGTLKHAQKAGILYCYDNLIIFYLFQYSEIRGL